MKIIRILTKGGQKHVTFLKDGVKDPEIRKFPETTSRKQIDEALKKLEAPATKPETTALSKAKEPK